MSKFNKVKNIIMTVLFIMAIFIEVSLKINNIDMSEFRFLTSYPLQHFVVVIMFIISALLSRVESITIDKDSKQ